MRRASSSSRTTRERSRGSTRCTTRRTARSTSRRSGVDVLLCSPYKFFGPHLGLAFGREELLRSWRPYKVRPAADEPVGARFETGTLAHELLAGFVAAVEYLDELGWDAIQAHERALGQRFLDGLPDRCTLYGLETMDGRVPTFAFRVDGMAPRDVAERLGVARDRDLGRRLLRLRGHDAARAAARRRRPGGVRPLQHVRGGRPAPRRARRTSRPRCPPSPPRRPRPSADRGGGSGPARARAARRARP